MGVFLILGHRPVPCRGGDEAAAGWLAPHCRLRRRQLRVEAYYRRKSYHLLCCRSGEDDAPASCHFLYQGGAPERRLPWTAVLNPNMIDYKTAPIESEPRHQFVILETPPPKADPPCPFGAFGVGEPSPTPATPAISMAIYNAIGKRFFEYPITPDVILKALGKIGSNEGEKAATWRKGIL